MKISGGNSWKIEFIGGVKVEELPKIVEWGKKIWPYVKKWWKKRKKVKREVNRRKFDWMILSLIIILFIVAFLCGTIVYLAL